MVFPVSILFRFESEFIPKLKISHFSMCNIYPHDISLNCQNISLEKPKRQLRAAKKANSVKSFTSSNSFTTSRNTRTTNATLPAILLVEASLSCLRSHSPDRRRQISSPNQLWESATHHPLSVTNTFTTHTVVSKRRGW